MYPVIPLDTLAGAAQVVLTLLAFAAAALSFLFCGRA